MSTTTVIAAVSLKGGSGKSSLALHLAVEADRRGIAVAVLDTDPQATASQWSRWRGEGSTPDVIDCASPPLLAGKVEALRTAGAELIIIDTPPSADSTAVAAVRVADLVLIPVRVRAFDLAAARATADLVQTWKKPAFAVWMAGPVRAPLLYKEGAEVAGVPVAPHMLPDRAAFHRGAGDGKAAQDLAPNGTAAREVAALFDWVLSQLIKGH